MESLDHYTLCNVASFLDIDSFRAFATSCRMFAACRNDPRTLATVALNSDKVDPGCLVFTHFGPAAIRFYAQHCMEDMMDACISALWLAVRLGHSRALSILVPLCDRATVEEILGAFSEDLAFAFEALKWLRVPPDVYQQFRHNGMAFNVDVLDAVCHFDGTGQLPTKKSAFVRLAEAILASGHVFLMGQLVSALEETDAAGSRKAANVDRVVALLKELPDYFCFSKFDFTVSMENQQSRCDTLKSLRPYAAVIARLFALAPRPLTLEHQLGMLDTFYSCGYFDQFVSLYAHSEEEAEMLFELNTLDSIFELVGTLDSQFDEGSVDSGCVSASPLAIDEPTSDGIADVIKYSLARLAAGDNWDINAILAALYRSVKVHDAGWPYALTITIMLHKHRVMPWDKWSIPELFNGFFEGASVHAGSMNQYQCVDPRAAVSLPDLAEFMKTLCEHHGDDIAYPERNYDETLRDILEHLLHLWPSEFEACLENCLRAAGDKNDTAVISILNSAANK